VITPKIVLYDATSDEEVAYQMGWTNARAASRNEAFTALRRAALLIRAHDNMAQILEQFGDFKRRGSQMRAESAYMRFVVRSAIGSHKV
jgi:hypothetical protein